MNFTKVFYVVFLFAQCTIQLTHSWKPIVGQSALTTSFSLKQAHPALDSKSYGPDNTEISSTILKESTETDNTKLTGIDFVGDSYGYGFDNDHQIAKSLYGEQDNCAVKKFAFNHDGTVQYLNNLPELNQFTICYWTRFTNHSGDHVILTYSAKDNPRAIQFWVANSNNSSFISMAIKGQQMYRLNYPLRMRQWHHTCSSWNGKTGEWQVWVKAERIGRGFHNSLVGHKIPPNGKLFSGGSSVTGKISQGLHFEIVFVQVYRIALSAGKAHRDHKHHHVHHFDHEGQELSTTTKSPPIINRPQPMHRLLASGQIPTNVRINLANPQLASQQSSSAINVRFPEIDSKSEKQSVTINTDFVNGQINTGSRLVAQQLLGISAIEHTVHSQSKTTTTAQQFDFLSNPANVQFIDETETHIQFKRNANLVEESNKAKNNNKIIRKRGLVFLEDGSIIDDSGDDFKFDGLTEFGDKQFKQDLSARKNIDAEIATHDREPAEDEVKAVMTLCSACDVEPFHGAIVFAWKNVNEKMDNVLKGSSVGRCGDF